MPTWVPKSLAEYDIHPDVVARLMHAAHHSCPPHVLLYGPPGTGKTTLARLYAHELLGQLDETNFMELNASDQRGIDVVRQKIKTFASLRSLATNLKVLILDEADFITKDAQSTLRAIMVDHRDSCKFVLTCNVVDKLDSAIKSRTLKSYVPLLTPKECELVAQKVCRSGGANRSDAFIKKLAQAAEGDIRYIDHNAFANSEELILTGKTVENLLRKLKTTPTIVALTPLEQRIPFSAYARVLRADFEELKPTTQRYLLLLTLLAEVDRRLIDGADKNLQVSWCLARYLQLLGSDELPTFIAPVKT